MLFRTSSFYFFYFMAVGIQVVFFTDILKEIGYSPYLIGIVFAMPGIIKFTLPFLFMKIKLTKTKLHIFQLIFITSSISLYFTIKHFYLLVLSISVIAFCSGVLLPLVDSIAMQTFGKDKYGKTRLWGSIGYIIIGLVLAKILNDYFLAIHVYLFTTVMIVVFSYLCIDESHLVLPKYKPTSTSTQTHTKQHYFWISLFLLQMSFGAMYGFFTIYEKSFGMSLESISYFWTIAVICEIVMLNYQSLVLQRFTLLTLLKFCIAITSFRWLLLYLYPDDMLIVYLSQSLHAFSFALLFSVSIAYIHEVYTNKNLAQLFFQGIIFGLSSFVGSIVFGILYGPELFLYAAIIAMISFIFILFQKENKT